MIPLPYPDQLDRHCELAPLAILERALEVTSSALSTVHPELWLENEHGPLDHQVPVEARRVLAQATRLRRAINRYRTMLDKRDEQESKAKPKPGGDVPL
jgi:hypothetical protein